MKNILNVYSRLLADVRHNSGVPLGTPDVLTASWVLKEGPKLEKAILEYLEHGWRIQPPEIPEWLKPLWDRFILTDDPKMLGYLRQVLLFCYKAEHVPSNEQLKEAQASFLEVDSGVGDWSRWFASNSEQSGIRALLRTTRQIVCRVTYSIDWLNIVPSHGPGAVSPHRDSWDKANFGTIYSAIQDWYPVDNYFVTSSHVSDGLDFSTYRESDRIQCKLVAVPKDSRGPRLICVHPAEAIWIQQGQRRLLEQAIERSPITSGKINFRDQKVNAMLALSASKDLEFCTLDLKEASDRISCDLVKYLFGGSYSIMSCARAEECVMLDGTIIKLEKWAPMGNCLTFPVESLVFYSLARAGILSAYGENCDQIYVFGDDLVFPSKYYTGVISALAYVGLAINAAKTFRLGFFRESCGTDAYKGVDVTPIRVKKASLSSVSDFVSWCDLAKRLRRQGYEETASFMYSLVRRRYHLPLVNDFNASGLYEYVERDFAYLLRNNIGKAVRFNKKLHRWEVKLLQVRPCLKAGLIHDRCHVLDSLIRLQQSCCESTMFDGYPLPYRERLSHGWTEIILS